MSRLLEGKVALVTGGGRGIGRAIAIGMAQAGAYVVVNDLGATLDGRPDQERPAKEVAAQIEALGGKAVVDGGSVAEWGGAQDGRSRGACVRPHRHRRQQRRHPARRDVLPHERAGIRRRGRGAPEGQLQRQPRRRPAFQVAGERLLRPHDLDLGTHRQLRAGELQHGQARRRACSRPRCRCCAPTSTPWIARAMSSPGILSS